MDIKAITPLAPIVNASLDKVNEKDNGQGVSFGDFLNKALDQVNNLQNESNLAEEKLATGESDDIAQVMIASEKANLALQLTVQIRTKVLDAYQEIMRMQV